MSASMIFLKLVLDGGKAVTGEATMENYQGQIDVDSISWKLSTKLLPKEDGAKKGRTEVRPKHLVISKVFDAASGNLCTAADNRTPFTKATLTMVSQEFEQSEASLNAAWHKLRVMQMVLTDGHIEDVNISASESNKSIALREKVTLSFAHSEMSYFPRKHQTADRFGAMVFKLEHPSSKG